MVGNAAIVAGVCPNMAKWKRSLLRGPLLIPETKWNAAVWCFLRTMREQLFAGRPAVCETVQIAECSSRCG